MFISVFLPAFSLLLSNAVPFAAVCFSFFFFNDTATTEIYTLSLHDALPIRRSAQASPAPPTRFCGLCRPAAGSGQVPAGTSRSREASGRQAKRNGAYLLVPRPALTCSQLRPQRDSPRTWSRGRSQLVTNAPIPGSRTCPP